MRCIDESRIAKFNTAILKFFKESEIEFLETPNSNLA